MGFWISSGPAASWKIDFGKTENVVNTVYVNNFDIVAPSADVDRAPQDFTLQGSNNDSNWVVLATVTGETAWSANESRNFVTDADSIVTPYRYFKIVITDNNGDASYTSIGEVYFWGSQLFSDLFDGHDWGSSSTHLDSRGSIMTIDADDWAPGFNPSYVASGNPAGYHVGLSLPHRWSIDFGNAALVEVFTVGIQANNVPEPDRMPQDFTIEGRLHQNDSWTVLATVTGETGWGNSELRWFNVPTPAGVLYRQISINISDNNGAALGRTQMGEVYLSGKKTLLPLPQNILGNDWTSDSNTPMAVSASSAYSSGYAAWRAVETVGSTGFWITTVADTLPVYWICDLGLMNTATLSTLEIRVNTIPEPTRAPRDFTIEGSNGDGWDVLATVTGETSWKDNEKRLYTMDDGYLTNYYRWFRIHITNNNGSVVTQLEEVWFWGLRYGSEYENLLGNDPSADPPVGWTSGTNGVQEITAGGFLTDYDPYKVVDGKTTGFYYWLCPDADPCWIKCDLGPNNTALLNNIQMTMNANDEGTRAPKNFTIEGSNDDSGWDVLYTSGDETGWASGETRSFETFGGFAGSEYRYFKINITANNGDVNYTQIAEVAFYGSRLPPVPWTEEFEYGTGTGDPIDETYWKLIGPDIYPDYYTVTGDSYLRMRCNQFGGADDERPAAQSKLLIDGDFDIYTHFKAIGGYEGDCGGTFYIRHASDAIDHFMGFETIVHLNQYYAKYDDGTGVEQDYVDLIGYIETGGVRVTRVGAVWTAYYWTGSWTQVGATANTIGTGSVFIEMQLNTWGTEDPYEWAWRQVMIDGVLSWDTEIGNRPIMLLQ